MIVICYSETLQILQMISEIIKYQFQPPGDSSGCGDGADAFPCHSVAYLERDLCWYPAVSSIYTSVRAGVGLSPRTHIMQGK